MWIDLKNKVVGTSCDSKSQLEVYLEMPLLDVGLYRNLDVLEWWKDQYKRFPNLSRMACDLLSVPITTVASESAFSIGGRVLNKYRSRLLPKKLQALLCTRSWLHGFDFSGKVHLKYVRILYIFHDLVEKFSYNFMIYRLGRG